jgi:hypothetical protein
MSNYDEDWQTHIKNNGANYNGVESQNEIISLLAANVKSKTIPKSGKFFSLIAEETMDLSKMEQVCVCLRYVEQDFTIQERFFGFFLQTLPPPMRYLNC